jgi:hypothetical protein
VNREAQGREYDAETSRLADRLRKHHEAATVEQQRKWQFAFTDYRQYLRSQRRVGFDNALALGEADRAMTEFVEKLRRRRLSDGPGMTIGKSDYRTIFRHHGVRELQVSSYSLKIRQNAAGYEDHPDPVGTKFDQRGPDIRIEHAIARYCPVVIECQNTEFQ